MFDLHILDTPGFWLSISFILFLILIGRPVWKLILLNLDAQSKAISAQLEEAKKARTEAETFLDAAREQKKAAAEQAEAILDHARKEGARLEMDASKSLEDILKREEKRAKESIARLEADSLKRLQEEASRISLHAAKEILTTLMSDKDAQTALDQKILEELKKAKRS
ncbi:MAG: hypothetical protein GY915_00620 [bacterium]|nr:hypothetical protein [bacterium]